MSKSRNFKELKDIAIVTMGLSPKGTTYNSHGNGLPLLNGPTEFGNVYPNCTLFTTDTKRQCQTGDLIFCVRGSTTGKMNWADQVYSLGRGVCSIRGKDQALTKFVKYALDLSLEALLALSGGSTFPNLNKDDIRKFEVPFSQEYKKIAAILTAYDDLIENNNKRIDLLEKAAEEIYREWFVRLRFPGWKQVNFVKGLPDGWQIQPFSEVVELKPTEKVDKKTPVPFASMGDLSTKSMMFSFSETRTDGSGTKFRNNDTLFPRITPSVENGKRGYVMNLDDGQVGLGSTEFIVFREKVVTSEYIYFTTCLPEFRKHAELSMTGASGRQRVQEDCFDYFLVKVPDGIILKKFTDLVRPFFHEIKSIYTSNFKLKQSRDLLLSRLISGKLSVEALDIRFPPSMIAQ